MKITLTKKLKTKNETIDNQHQKIVKQFDRILKLIDLKRSKRDISREFETLLGIVDVHFKTEEKLMSRYAYRQMPLHVSDHRVYRNNLNIINNVLIENVEPEKLRRVILAQAVDWHGEHIRKFDIPLGAFIKEENGR